MDSSDNGAEPARGYRDLHEHLAELERRGLLLKIDRQIDKDSELHALVRWQFVGGMSEAERKAFLFTNIVDGQGRRYDIPVVVGALAANRAVYSVGMDAPVEGIQAKWDRAIANPVKPLVVQKPPCQEVILEGDALVGPGNGLGRLPIPISTPGFDSSPTLTATNVVTKDPETGGQNMGTYRCALKAPDRMVVRLATRVGGADGYLHYTKHQKRGDRYMPCAIVLGCPPYVAFMGPQKLPIGVDELDVAGGLAGHPIRITKAHSVDLMVPAEAEVVIEGMIDTETVEPEAPFGESHGHVALEEFNMVMKVTAITHRRDAVIPSYISQVAPSESSVIKRVAYEPLFLTHLRDGLGIRGVKRVTLHEPLTGLLRVTMITCERGMPRTEVWRALYGAAFFKGDCSKICIAINDDIDP
ncbi:MAG: UbiD family decarboxylase domain-containing protein, partial [bacterium]